MKDHVYPYERTLYSRSFLNCYQRQSLVMLAERVPDLHHLFHKCLISTDDILEQTVRRQRPKYDFESGFFQSDDLLKVGVAHREMSFDTYSEARQLLLDTVSRDGFVLLVIDVFYLRHCPEYFNKHVVHTITLKEYDADSHEWALVDENPASVLCTYTYHERVIAAAYDNNVLRRVRSFEHVGFDVPPSLDTREKFFGLLDKHQDSRALFTRIDDIIDCPWIATDVTVALLHDAFSLYQGSRTCLLEYLTHTIGDATLNSDVQHIVEQATNIQNALLVAKVTGAVDPNWMTAACADLDSAEAKLVSRLQAIGNGL